MSRASVLAMLGWGVFAAWLLAVGLAPPEVTYWLTIHTDSFEPLPGPETYLGRAAGVAAVLIAWAVVARMGRARLWPWIGRVALTALAVGLVACALLEAGGLSVSAGGAFQGVFWALAAALGLTATSRSLGSERPGRRTATLRVLGIALLVCAAGYAGLVLVMLTYSTR